MPLTSPLSLTTTYLSPRSSILYGAWVSAVFEAKKWKRSRVKKGYLIARIAGYDPVESEYGVSYLKVLSRNPKKTSGDYSLHEHAGFFTWGALQAGGRFVKERKRYERVTGDRANAS